MNKKGVVWDIITISIVLFVIGISVIISDLVLFEFSENVNTTAMTGETSLNALEKGVTTLKTFNYLFIVILIGLSLTAIIGAFMIQTHPAMFWISMVLLGIVIFIGVILSNVFTEVTETPQLINITQKYEVITTVMDNLPLYALIIGALVLIVLYAKTKFGGDLL